MTRRPIAEELKQTRPFASRADEATVALLRTAHVVRRRLDAVAESEGITSQQYNVLRILRGARGPLPTMEIADRMIEPACGITRIISTLENAGLVKREQWAGDRRQVLCQITATGKGVLDRLDEPVRQLDDATLGTLSDEQLDELLDILSHIRELAGEPE